MSKETVGEYLKKERELRQISLQEVSDGTKISIRRLVLIEENKFDDLPAEVFVRGFIRNYAEYIGIDPEEAIMRLEEDLKSQYGSTRPNAATAHSQEGVGGTSIDVRSRKQKRGGSLWPIILALILAAIIGLGLYFYFFKDQGLNLFQNTLGGGNSTQMENPLTGKVPGSNGTGQEEFAPPSGTVESTAPEVQLEGSNSTNSTSPETPVADPDDGSSEGDQGQSGGGNH